MTSATQPLFVPSLKNILFATDFSPCSQVAFPYLRAIAERYGSTVHIVHVLIPEPMLEAPLDRFAELDADLNVAKSTMKTMVASKPLGQIAYTTTVKRGPLWKVLESVIEEKKIDLLVLGTHGRQGFRKLVLGSFAEQVFRSASCPVLTIGPHSKIEGIEQLRIASILFSTDCSPNSQKPLLHAESVARANHSHLTVLYAVPPSVEFEPGSFDAGPVAVKLSAESAASAIATARQQVEKMISAETMAELKPEIVVECGPPAETILRVAKSRQVDLIVMGAHHATAKSLVAHLPWATTSTVICQSHCPVLTVRN
jgi:nucleotide-binding universal stress UspA family protein